MKSIIALGAENKAAFSVIRGNDVYLSEPVDDLNNIDNFTHYERSIREYLIGNNITPGCIACDMHPDYHSSVLARVFARENAGASVLPVQHHFAHIAACMLDNCIDEMVIGVSFDGTGYGSDGKSWGSEFLVCDRKDFSRKYHLRYMPQPGGDIAAKEPWRMALSYLNSAYAGKSEGVNPDLKERVGASRSDIILRMISGEINCPLTSSMGRLFDAVSSILGICDVSTFEAEAAIKLEAEACSGITQHYNYEICGEEIDVSKTIRGIISDMKEDMKVSIISAKFHNTIGEIVFNTAEQINKDTGIKKVLLSGGCFQNKYLVNCVEQLFKGSELELYKHKKYSPTDLGVSIGQAVVANSLRGQ